MVKQRISRRELLRRAAVGASAVVAAETLVAPAALASPPAAPAASPQHLAGASPPTAPVAAPAAAPARDHLREGFQALNEWQARMVDAIAGRIFPTTDTPGAHEAGVVYFIDRALAGYLSKPTSANPEDQNPVYRRSLDAVDRYAQFKFGRGFLELDGAEQDQVLMDLQDGVEETKRFFKRPTAPAFFNLIRTHVIQGLFSDPMYGGNRDMIGWKLIGFGGAQFGYTEEEMRVRHQREPLSLADHFQYEHGGTG